jgi:hypothetical protein
MDHWYNIQFVTGGVCALGLLTWFFVPESVRWQAQNGQIKEAKITLLKIAEVNGNQMNDAKREEIDQGQLPETSYLCLWTTVKLLPKTCTSLF